MNLLQFLEFVIFVILSILFQYCSKETVNAAIKDSFCLLPCEYLPLFLLVLLVLLFVLLSHISVVIFRVIFPSKIPLKIAHHCCFVLFSLY